MCYLVPASTMRGAGHVNGVTRSPSQEATTLYDIAKAGI